MTRERPLGVAVVGLGIGEAHARTYLTLDGCAVRRLYDLDRDRTAAVVSSLGAGEPAESFEALLADPDVDLVSIASYDDAHFAQVDAALAAGKHVFVEKPLCRTLDERRAVERTWRASGRHLASNLVLRAAPLYRWLRTAIADGELGEVYAFDADYLYGRVEKITAGWRRDVDDYSVVLGGGVHLVDLMLWLTGQRPATVVAAGSRLATRGSGFRYDDYVAATFTFASGLVGRITANFGCVHRHQHVVRVFGTRATFIHDDAGPRLHRSRAPESAAVQLELAPVPASKGALIPEFVTAILTGAPSSAPTQHELDVVSACVAADEACAAGKPVEVQYD